MKGTVKWFNAERECSYRSKYIDIRVNEELKRYFEKCLEDVLNVGMEKD